MSAGKTRLELLGNEIEEEKLRAINLLLTALGMVFCLSAAGTLIAVFFLSALFWESRLFVLGAAAGFFLVLGLVFFALFKRATQRPEKMFAASIAEIAGRFASVKGGCWP